MASDPGTGHGRPESGQERSRKAIWVLRAVWLLAAIAGVHFLGGGAWFFAGLCLGWLGCVAEVAADENHAP